ncbi:MAG: hypothetical protein ABT02_16175 [Comamonadaceae bacterium SCN 68-20]|nr:MAG: hypothetical protein ABT02_16175 [Comamonadaceae bacterium SCN 68-20]OJX35640.1 MAG: hypothetical protein BGO75_00060 [Burkholderiales bacterium 68-20]
MLLAALPASAAWVLPPGAEAALGGGAVSLGCADVANGGALHLGAGATLAAARDVATQAGALLDLDGARLELAGQWTAAGQVSASGGAQVLRTASPGCPVAGRAGPVPLGGAPASTPVPALEPWALALLALAVPALAGRARKTPSSR